jgi:hypothetical protein
MKRLVGVIAVALVLGTAMPVSGHFGFLSRPRATTAYYIAVPAVAVYPAPVAVCVPVAVPVVPPRIYAQPQPAPPSTGKEPPLAEPAKPATPQPGPPGPPEPKGPQTQVSNYFDSYAVAATATTQAAAGRCSVSFWNLSGQELVLKVGERRVPLANGRRATLELDREFTWQIEGRNAQTARIATNDTAQEIVIRR